MRQEYVMGNGAIALGALGAKATAEANNETRNDN